MNSIVVLLLAPLLFALFEKGVLFFSAVPDWSVFRWVALGMVLYVPIYLLFSGNLIPLLGTLEHELCHATAMYASFGQVAGIAATAQGGGGTLGTPSYFLVSLAPYCVPLFTLPLLPVRLVVTPSALPIVDVLIGLTLAFHFVEVATTIWGHWQTDFDKAGPIALVLVPPAFTMIFLVLIASGVLDDYGLFLDYLRNVVTALPEYYRTAFSWVAQLAERVVGLIG